MGCHVYWAYSWNGVKAGIFQNTHHGIIRICRTLSLKPYTMLTLCYKNRHSTVWRSVGMGDNTSTPKTVAWRWTSCESRIWNQVKVNHLPIILIQGLIGFHDVNHHKNISELGDINCYENCLAWRWHLNMHYLTQRDFLGPKRPGSLYIILLCILKESFSLETLCIPQEYCFTQYYVWNKMDCNYSKSLHIFLWKSYTKDWNGPLRPGAIVVRNSNKTTYL